MLTNIREIWIVKGEMTDAEVHGPQYKNGDVEWQFSDGPPSKRSFSVDFPDLESGLRMFSGCKVHFVDE